MEQGGQHPSEPGSLPDGMTSQAHVFLQASDSGLNDRIDATDPVAAVRVAPGDSLTIPYGGPDLIGALRRLSKSRALVISVAERY